MFQFQVETIYHSQMPACHLQKMQISFLQTIEVSYLLEPRRLIDLKINFYKEFFQFKFVQVINEKTFFIEHSKN
jgi:hypothetical protein